MTDIDPAAWTAIPAPPKVPNFWQGHGYTLHYASPGWTVHEGLHDKKETLGEVLFHARTAREAKAYVEETAAKKPARKPRPRKTKTTDTASDADATSNPPS